MYSEYNRLLDKHEDTIEELHEYKQFAKEVAGIIFGVEKEDISTNELQAILKRLKDRLAEDYAETEIELF
jgi:hypothetical protein